MRLAAKIIAIVLASAVSIILVHQIIRRMYKTYSRGKYVTLFSTDSDDSQQNL